MLEIRKNINYRPISKLEMTMRQTLEGMEDFSSSFGFSHSTVAFELLDLHAVEPLPTKTISHPFSARIPPFPGKFPDLTLQSPQNSPKIGTDY